jgi:hypothetical protein
VKLSVGYKSMSDAADRPLGEGDIGEVLVYDGSSRPYKIKALTGAKKDNVWWYDKGAVESATDQFIASALEASGKEANESGKWL